MTSLRFDRASPYHLASGCGRYTVDGARINSSGRIRYGAWLVTPAKNGAFGKGEHRHDAVMLGCFDSVDAAKARCEQHAKGETHESQA